METGLPSLRVAVRFLVNVGIFAGGPRQDQRPPQLARPRIGFTELPLPRFSVRVVTFQGPVEILINLDLVSHITTLLRYLAESVVKPVDCFEK